MTSRLDRERGILRSRRAGVAVGPDTTPEELAALEGFEREAGAADGAATFRAELPAGELFELPTLLRVEVRDGRVETVELVALEATAEEREAATREWRAGSMHREWRRKALHDAWLREELGADGGVFDWGSADSVLDDRSGSCLVLIRYRLDGRAMFPAGTVDAASGELRVRRATRGIGPRTTRAEFLESRAGRVAVADSETDRETSYSFPVAAGDLFDDAARVVVRFDGERLARVEWACDAERFGRSWQDWSLLKEDERRAVHDAWLAARSLEPGSWPWGHLESTYDADSRCALLRLTY